MDAINGYAIFFPIISESQKNYYIDVALISSQGLTFLLLVIFKLKIFFWMPSVRI
jgi:hypothetical protein